MGCFSYGVEKECLEKSCGIICNENERTNVDATIKLKHHEEARLSTELKAKNGAFKQGEELRLQ